MKKSTTRKKFPAKKTTRKLTVKPRRKRGWERLCEEREKELYKHVITQRAGTEKTYTALTTLLVELSNVTQIDILDSKILRIFYRRAMQVAVESDGSTRHQIFEVIGDIGKVLDIELPDETLEYVATHAQFPRMTAEETVANLISPDTSKAGYRPSLFGSDRPNPEPNPELERLRDKFQRLERLPENEAIALQLESEIYRLERETDTDGEWPDMIGGAQ